MKPETIHNSLRVHTERASGVETILLESDFGDFPGDRSDSVQAQRDTLLEAIKRALNYMDFAEESWGKETSTNELRKVLTPAYEFVLRCNEPNGDDTDTQEIPL